MEKFSQILSEITPSCFKFINQRTVKVIGFFVPDVSNYTLSKSDVILAIKTYCKCIHFYSSAPIRSEKFNFSALKMYDLVPYLYTLINLFLTKQNDLPFYHRYLPELVLTRFCHLPFEGEIDFHEIEVKTIQCALLDDFFGGSRYCCLISGIALSASSLDELLRVVSVRFPNLVKSYDLHFVSP